MGVTLVLTQEFLDDRVIAITGATADQNFLNVPKLRCATRDSETLHTVRNPSGGTFHAGSLGLSHQ
jgi:hypothetical protein